MEEINDRIKKVRENKGLNITEFAKELRVSRTLISQIEGGSVPITKHNIMVVCNVFSVNESWLLTGEGDMFVKKPEQDPPPPEPTRFPTTILDKDGKPLNEEERRLIEIYRELLPINQDLIRSNAKVSLASQRNTQDLLENKDRERGEAESKGQTGA